MKNKTKNKIFAFAMALCLIFTSVPLVFSQGNEIEISSKEDFVKFAKKCTLDTYSKDKIFRLNCDIDFSDEKFSPVPVFNGTFNGNGHTISGVEFTQKGSYTGIFRYVFENGKILNLNVKGNFEPNGSKSFVGGIAGENSGEIRNCTFWGNVKGENVVGGIAGSNTESGKIVSCTSGGNVNGENSTGGISGKNSGFIQNCKNKASVNTVYEEKKKELTDIEADTGAIIENYKLSEEQNEEESILGHTDTGGIAGYNSGIVQGCVNNANVGYEHIGYNVGGIAGRQSGYMLGNKNYGTVKGRKDVGGIAGQAEPYILLSSSENILKDLRGELNTLNRLVNNFTDDADSLGDKSHFHLESISKYTKNAKNSTENMLDLGTDFIDDNISEINAQSAVISNTIDKLTPVFESLENGSGDVEDALKKMSEAISDIKVSIPDISNELEQINTGIDEIVKSESNLRKGLTYLRRSIDSLQNAFEFNNASDVRKAFSDISSAIGDIITARENMKEAIEKIEEIIKKNPEKFEDLGTNTTEILNNLKIIKENNDKIITSLKTVNNNFKTIIKNGKFDYDEFKDIAPNLKASIGYISNAMYYLTKGLDVIGEQAKKISDKIDLNEDDFNKAVDDLSEATELLGYGAENLTEALSDMKGIFEDLSNEKPLEFVKLGDDFKNESESLFNSLDDISSEIDKLRDVVSAERKTLKNDISSITNQFNVVMNLLIDEVDDLKNGLTNTSDLFLDVSDEDIENARQGKIKECKNYGSVEADRNTGGIAGAVSIEYTKDPEDEIERPDSLNFTYRTKAVLHSCVNEGKIIGKKDCVSGIAGLLDIGTAFECESYGNIESTNGNYVGGIAGKSNSSVKKCYSKSKISGKSFVGGIVGNGDNVKNCYAIVSIMGEENIGSICGNCKSRDKLYKNYFVNKGVGGADNISYSEKAEPVSFEKLKEISDIPRKFISFTVTFKADGKTVETQDIKYGEKTSRIKYPPIPEKKGCFGKWKELKAQTVTENIEIECEYQPYITILSSEEKEGKLALCLAEGEFTDEAVLTVTENKKEKPKNAYGNTKVYDVALTGTDIKAEDGVFLRILNKNKDNVTAYVLKNGEWEKTEASYKGKYVVLKTKGTDNTIFLKYEKRNMTILVWGILAGLFFVFTLVCLKKKYKKKA